MRKISMFLMALMLLFTTAAFGQLTGTKNIPGDYATLAAAIADLNTQGVGSGGVTFNVAAGYTETFASSTAGLITATGTLANPIVFQKSGVGVNPLITAGTGVSTTVDGIIVIKGGDFISFNSIDLSENSANVTATTQMEWGYAIVKSSITDGAKNINISNCAITLNKTNTASVGIYANNHTDANTTLLTIADVLGTNQNIKINGCTITNCYQGIYVKGFTTTATYYDSGLEIGSTTGNTISNYGGGSVSTNGIYITGQTAPKIENNTVTLATGTTTTAYGINVASACIGDLLINLNTLSVSSSATTSQLAAINNAAPIATVVNITNNIIQNCDYTAATTGSFYGIYEQGATTGSTVNITGNTIKNSSLGSLTTTGSGTFYGVYVTSGSPTAVNVNSNTINGNINSGTTGGTVYGIFINKGTTQTANSNNIFDNSIVGTGTAGSFYGIKSVTGTVIHNLNNIYNNSIAKATATSGTNYGIYNLASPTNETYNSNNIYNLTSQGTNNIAGIYVNTTTGTRTVANNIIYGLATNGSIYGIYTASSSPNIYKNKIYNLSGNGASSVVSGIYLNSGTTINIYNNFISDLKAPLANTAMAIAGIYVNGGTTANLYFNTIYLNATSTGALFGTSGIYASTTPTVDMRNNIIVNSSTPMGTGYTVAYRRSAASLTTYAATSNNNCLYAGTPGANNVIFYDGTTPQPLISDFKTLVSPRDGASFSENVAFVNAATAPYDLHVNTVTPTYCESGGLAITSPISITDDIDGTVRGATPDVGADEFAGIAAGVINPSIAASVLNSQQISLAITPNVSANNIVIVWNTTGTFTAPSGVPPTTVGDAFAGGSFLYNGVTSPVVHSGLTLGTTYYYKAFSYDGANYSSGVTANATTNVAAPVAFTATAFSASQINLVWTKNAASNNVIIATNSTSTFGTPVNGTALNVSDAIVGGGTVIYNGPLALFNHTALTAQTTYYYKAWSVDTYNAYSATGLTANATTPCAAIAVFPSTESFSATLGCWSASEAVAGATLHWATVTADASHGVSGPQAGTNFMALNVYSASATYNPYYLTSPSYTLDATAKRVKYYYWLGASGNTLTPVPLTLQISTNGGSTWTDLYAHTTSNSTFTATSSIAGWNQNIISLAAYTGQTVMFRFASNSNYGSGYCNQGIDEFVIEDIPACVAPSVLTATAITATGANLGWTAGGTETLWNVEYGATGFTQGTGTTVTGVTNPYTVSGLTQNTTYQFYVQADCGGSGTSTWAGPFSFTTPYSCPKPTVPTVTNITATTADLGWTNGGTETAWIVYYKTAAATDYTEVTGVTTNPYTLGGLTPATNYIFKVKANCSVSDTSFVSGTQTFTTLCNAVTTYPHNEPFTNYLPSTCWTEGDAGDLTAGPTTISATASSWGADGFLNSGSTGAIKINIDAATDNDWIISPEFTIPAAPIFRLKYSVGATQWNATTAPTTPWESDDYVQVLVSTTYPANWTVLKTFNDLNTPSNLGQIDMLDLSAYAGQTIRIAFRGVEGATDGGADIDFFVDDFTVEAVPTCEAPTALTATAITSTDATLGWTAGGTETLWNVEYGVTGFTQGTGTIANGVSNAYAITGLSQNTTYQFYVQADCGGAGTSTWAGPFSFTTACDAVSTFPWSESFDGTTFAPTCWSNTQTAGTGTTSIWNRSTSGSYPTTTPHSGAGMASYNCFNFSSGKAAQLVTPALNFPTDLYEVKFWMYRDNEYLSKLDLVNVYYNTTPNTTGATLLGTVNRNNTLAPVEATANQWYQYKFNMPAGAAGNNRYIVFEAVSAYGNNIFIDDISVDVIPACVAPTALNATSITASGATLGWTAGGTETTWNVEYGVTGFTQGTGTIANGVSNAYAITGLTQNTTYQFYVQADCGGSGTSTWSGPVSFSTAYSCPKPTLPTVSNITAVSADLAWTAGGTETEWIVYYKTAAATNYTEVLNVTTNPYTLSGLASGTNYIFKVKANCSVSDTSVMSNTQTFATTCAAITALPYVEPFATYLPSVCWLEGDAGDLTAGPTTISATAAAWIADGFLNNGSTGAARINVYGTTHNDWLISPEITIPAGSHRLKYSVGATEFGDVIAPVEAWESDDVVQVLVTTSYPTNWTVLKTFDNTNVPSYLGQDDIIDLAAYAGQTIRIAYRALMGSTNGGVDIDFFVDNFTVEAVPSCEAPLSLIANAITSNSVDVAFTSAAPNFNVRYRLAGATTWTTTTANASPVSITGLTHSSQYEVQIMAFCSATDSSAWSSVLNFSTLCGVYQVPFLQDFNVAPNCWTLSRDTLNSSIDLSGTSSSWGLDNYLNIASGQMAARLNIYGSTMNSWLLSPEINLGTGANQLEFDLAATEYADITDASGTREDDKFAIVISTDGGTTWNQANVLRQWDNTGSTYVYNNINATPQHITIDLSAYTGIVKIAFYGESFVSGNGDNDLFVDNVAVNPIPVPCATPTALAATNIAQTTADLGWTSTAANFNVRYRAVGATTWTDATASTTTLALTSLTANTQYEFQVQAVCSTTPGDTSAWATTATFTTLIPVCATPTALTATGITETAANLGWTSTATNFNVRYRTVGATTWTAATANTTTLALTSLTANTQYEFQVQAVCSATPGDTSAWATAATFTTLTPATCNAPSALVVSAINSAGATLNWTAGGTETAWNIRYKKVADATYTNVNNTTTKPYVLTTLQSNTAYVWNVQAVCSSTLTSAWSADNTFNTTVGIDNNTLTNLSVFSYDNQINVINSGNILVKSVVIYNMIGQEVGTYAINSTDNILVNTNLVIGTYMVKVVTADKVGTYKLFIK